MHNRIQARLSSWEIDSRDKVLLAFSGGLDSRCLLELLLELGFQPELAHCNFKLRGEAADKDEQFCRDLASSKGLKIHVKSFKTESYAQTEKLSIQMAARELRYRFFASLMESEGYRAVLTAHHADDQIETMLFKLARGSALEGVTGIPAQRGFYHRPLLDIYRSELEDYAQSKNLHWREDLSNQDDKYLRNAYRLHLIPKWENLQANLKGKLLRSSELLKEQNQSLNSLLQEKLEQFLQKSDDEELIEFEKLCDKEYWNQLLFYWLSPKGAWDWAAVQNLAFTKKGRYVICDQWILSREQRFLKLAPLKEASKIEVQIEDNTGELEGLGFHLEMGLIPKSDWVLDPSPSMHYFDYDKLQFPLQLRNWQEGDRFQPLGMSGKKKVSDYLIDQKISIQAKAAKMVLCSQENIIALLGERIDHRFRVQNSSKTIYFVRLRYTNITS